MNGMMIIQNMKIGERVLGNNIPELCMGYVY